MIFDLQLFAATEKVSQAITWRTTSGDVITRKFSYINPSATDEQLSNFAKALTRLTTSTFVISRQFFLKQKQDFKIFCQIYTTERRVDL